MPARRTTTARPASPRPASVGRGGRTVATPRPEQVKTKTAGERRAERREKKRQAVVEAAARLFAQLGYADCEMDRVAAAMRVAKGTLYLYFPAKQELFFACVDWGMKQMLAAVQAAADRASDPLDKINRAVRAYLEFFGAHPQYVELLIQERAIFRDRKRPTYFEHRDVARVAWRELYEQLVRNRRLRGDLPTETLLDAVGNLVYGTMFTNHFLGRSTLPEETLQGLLEVVFHGIVHRSGRDRPAPRSPRSKSSRASS